jgi:hypothetical protein
MAFRETEDHIMYNLCTKFHQNPCIKLGGVGGTNLCLWTDREADRQTDRLIPVYPPNFVAGGIKKYQYNIISVLLGFILVGFVSFRFCFTLYRYPQTLCFRGQGIH